jgi:hypothetical protein
MRRQLCVVFASFGEHVQWRLGETHGLCDECSNVATASMLESWIDESERRAWFVFETARPATCRSVEIIVPKARTSCLLRVQPVWKRIDLLK